MDSVTPGPSEAAALEAHPAANRTPAMAADPGMGTRARSQSVRPVHRPGGARDRPAPEVPVVR
jgi:hypothetical protein